MNKQQKKKELLEKREKYEEKLKNLKIGFRGVRHEDSASEIRYSMIKVYEDFINSIDEEIAKLDQEV
jgi:hypothetical protein